MFGARSALRWMSIAAVLTTAGDVARAATPLAGGPTFASSVAAVFRRHCVRCHGPHEASGGLRLDSYQNVLRGGEEGPAIVASDLNASLLFQKVLRRDEPPMPPRKRLPARDVAKLRAWIEAGALP